MWYNEMKIFCPSSAWWVIWSPAPAFNLTLFNFWPTPPPLSPLPTSSARFPQAWKGAVTPKNKCFESKQPELLYRLKVQQNKMYFPFFLVPCMQTYLWNVKMRKKKINFLDLDAAWPISVWAENPNHWSWSSCCEGISCLTKQWRRWVINKGLHRQSFLRWPERKRQIHLTRKALKERLQYLHKHTWADSFNVALPNVRLYRSEM